MQYVRSKGIVRPRDLEALGIPREYLLRLHRQGKLSRTGRGIYSLPDAAVTERHSYAEVAKRCRKQSCACFRPWSFTKSRRKARRPSGFYSAAKTVADCFKFRNKIGLDIAIEALKDCLRQKKATINDIYRYAKICRVSNVIRPCMEAL